MKTTQSKIEKVKKSNQIESKAEKRISKTVTFPREKILYIQAGRSSFEPV